MEENWILFDVDTQRCFFNPRSNGYVEGSRDIKLALEMVIDFARKSAGRVALPIVGSVRIAPKGSRIYCAKGAAGTLKVPETIIKNEGREEDGSPKGGFDLGEYYAMCTPDKISRRALAERISEVTNEYSLSPTYFEHPEINPFSNPQLKFFLEMLEAKKALVFGINKDDSLILAANGLRDMGIECYLAREAIAGLGSVSNVQTTPLKDAAEMLGLRFFKNYGLYAQFFK